MKINPIISQKISIVAQAAKNTAKKVKGQLTPENISKVKNQIRSSKFANDMDKFVSTAKSKVKTAAQSDEAKVIAEKAKDAAKTAGKKAKQLGLTGLNKAEELAKSTAETVKNIINILKNR